MRFVKCLYAVLFFLVERLNRFLISHGVRDEGLLRLHDRMLAREEASTSDGMFMVILRHNRDGVRIVALIAEIHRLPLGRLLHAMR